MQAKGTMTVHKEMEDMRKETLYRTTCLGGRIAGSHDIKQDSLYLHKEGQLNTKSTEHNMSFLSLQNAKASARKKVMFNRIS
jgi:hypothetical protein